MIDYGFLNTSGILLIHLIFIYRFLIIAYNRFIRSVRGFFIDINLVNLLIILIITRYVIFFLLFKRHVSLILLRLNILINSFKNNIGIPIIILLLLTHFLFLLNNQLLLLRFNLLFIFILLGCLLINL